MGRHRAFAFAKCVALFPGHIVCRCVPNFGRHRPKLSRYPEPLWENSADVCPHPRGAHMCIPRLADRSRRTCIPLSMFAGGFRVCWRTCRGQRFEHVRSTSPNLRRHTTHNNVSIRLTHMHACTSPPKQKTCRGTTHARPKAGTTSRPDTDPPQHMRKCKRIGRD